MSEFANGGRLKVSSSVGMAMIGKQRYVFVSVIVTATVVLIALLCNTRRLIALPSMIVLGELL